MMIRFPLLILPYGWHWISVYKHLVEVAQIDLPIRLFSQKKPEKNDIPKPSDEKKAPTKNTKVGGVNCFGDHHKPGGNTEGPRIPTRAWVLFPVTKPFGSFGSGGWWLFCVGIDEIRLTAGPGKKWVGAQRSIDRV
ncbi:hypothetical protein [Desulfosarcina ovata]|uniref:hypothetical protein n=1 Tax=Desulfosarcina ovata TaxID=83564 RepID=UPI0012D2CD43|nr:hypothetical protein [Desulfosarcina ovata]